MLGTSSGQPRIRNVPGGSVSRTSSFHCRGYGFDPWFSRLEKFHMPNSEAKKSKREREKEC